MRSGYVLDFSDRTFAEFVLDATGKKIFDAAYHHASGSKANRLRAFWLKEPDHVVAQLLAALLEYAKDSRNPPPDTMACAAIIERLRRSASVPDLSALEPNTVGRQFEALAKSIKESIEGNEPETGLDRLHTFVVKYVRVLCGQHGIDATPDKPLHSLFGEYLKSLKKRSLVESEMTERILKSTISVLEAFNDVRNNRSLAHDNPLLGCDEALLIFSNVASAVRFLSTVERGAAKSTAREPEADDEIPL